MFKNINKWANVIGSIADMAVDLTEAGKSQTSIVRKVSASDAKKKDMTIIKEESAFLKTLSAADQKLYKSLEAQEMPSEAD